MFSCSPIARDGGKGIRSITLGPISSLLWTLGLVVVLIIVARASLEEPPESIVQSGSAGQTVLTWRNHPIFALAWSPDGCRLAASGWGPQVRLWELETGIAKSLESDDGCPRFVLGWSADGRGIGVGDLEGRVDSWDAAEGPGPAGARLTGPSNDGRAMAQSSRGASIRLWDPVDRRSTLLPIAGRSANAIAFTPDGRTIASAGRDGVVRVWEAESGRLRHAIPVGGIGVNLVAFSPDGTRLTSGGCGPARVWDVASGREVARLGASESGFSTLAFSPDGRRLAGATWSGKVRVWDLETGRELANLSGNEGHVHAMAWSPDGGRLAWAGYDATVRICDLRGSR